jgi:hypothetical protein
MNSKILFKVWAKKRLKGFILRQLLNKKKTMCKVLFWDFIKNKKVFYFYYLCMVLDYIIVYIWTTVILQTCIHYILYGLFPHLGCASNGI